MFPPRGHFYSYKVDYYSLPGDKPYTQVIAAEFSDLTETP